MNEKQIAIVLYKLRTEKKLNIDELLNDTLGYYGLKPEQKSHYFKILNYKYNNGIKHLNNNQLANIISKIESDGYQEETIRARLNFYQIDISYLEEIINFFKSYSESNIPIDVSEIDKNFKGVQVASRDDFNMIINQGYTGDWVLTPSSVIHRFVQVASMNETGRFPRGNFLNAEIENIEPIEHGGQIRYRIFIKNPIVIDSGNRNIKFNMNPVKYIN